MSLEEKLARARTAYDLTGECKHEMVHTSNYDYLLTECIICWKAVTFEDGKWVTLETRHSG